MHDPAEGGDRGALPATGVEEELFSLFAQLIYRISGIRLLAQKRDLLVARLLKRVKELGLRDFHAYYKLVRADEREQVEMLNRISTNTTHFFREPHHFTYLYQRVLPELCAARARTRTLRIWSAGCSTGEEPYSIAVTLCEFGLHRAAAGSAVLPSLGALAGWDVKILASDLSTRVLAEAERGVYPQERLEGDVPPLVLRRHFLKGTGAAAGQIKAKDGLRQMIRFRALNLRAESYPFRRLFDVIFCRNVMIYFDTEMKRHVLELMHRHLAPDGYLFVGHSESMVSLPLFEPVHITTYRKR